MPRNDRVGVKSFHPNRKHPKSDGLLNLKSCCGDVDCYVPRTTSCPKVYAVRDFSPPRGPLASNMSEVGTNVESAKHSDVAGSAVCIPSTPLRSVNRERVESLASQNRVHPIGSKKTVARESRDLTFTNKRPKLCATRELPTRYGDLASHINERRTELCSNAESSKLQNAAKPTVGIPLKALRSVNSDRVESLASQSRVHQIGSKKTVARENRDLTFTNKRPKLCSTRELPTRYGNLASHINERGTEFCSNAESSKLQNAAKSAVGIRRRAHEIKRMKTATQGNDVISLKIMWKEEDKGMSSMFVPPTQSMDHALVQASYPSNRPVVESYDKPILDLSVNEVVSLNVAPHDLNQVARNKVKAALAEFEKLSTQLLNEYKAETKGEDIGARRVDIKVAECLRKKGKWICSEKQLGHIQGITIGDQFQFRAELAVVGLHCQYVSGIDFMSVNGKNYATSIVDSGRYENRDVSLDVLIYTGQGGNPQFGTFKSDQELKSGNLALRNSMNAGYPVRVIRKNKCWKASTLLHMNGERGLAHPYVYEGLYLVKKNWSERERDKEHRLVFKFELHRIEGQPILSLRAAKDSRKFTVCKERCVVEDVTQGKEKIPIRVMNGIDDEKPQHFTYITNVTYSDGCKRSKDSGCNCTNGCSNIGKCLCVLKNEGDISFNERGTILGQKDIVYECGPSCQCPPSCINRVSQHGPRYKLEIFKTKLQSWGVRSRSYISSGSFVCEYIGNLLQIKNAPQRARHEQVGFMYAGFESRFIVDPVKFGNVGRFISHSDSPNLVARYILYDHDDKRMPHIMLFAAKNIPPLHELTYDYNHVRARFPTDRNA